MSLKSALGAQGGKTCYHMTACPDAVACQEAVWQVLPRSRTSLLFFGTRYKCTGESVGSFDNQNLKFDQEMSNAREIMGEGHLSKKL